MPNLENWKVWIPSGIGAYFAAGLVFYFCHFISNTYSASGVVAIVAGFAFFVYFSSQANDSMADLQNPAPMLVDLSPVRVLAEVKDALASKYFGDKKWTVDNINEQKGTANFVCRVKKSADKTQQMKEHITILVVKSHRLSKASSMELHFDIIGEKYSNQEARKLCKETTEHLEQHMQAVINQRSNAWA